MRSMGADASGDVRRSGDRLPTIHLIDDVIELLARTSQGIRPEEQMQRWRIRVNELQDAPGPSNRIADLFAIHFPQRLEDLARRSRVVIRSFLGPADRMIREKVGPELSRRNRRDFDPERCHLQRQRY